MSGKKDEKAQVAADRIKAATLTTAKGLSRAQAERAATTATRNVNAYGQKEEGPSRWQEQKEANRLMSTEKQVRLGERKDLKTSMPSVGASSSQCQKCFEPGHRAYECKNERVYISRPSRTQQLKNPNLKMKLLESDELDNPDIVKIDKVEKPIKKSKRKHRSRSDSGSNDSEASVFDSDSSASSVTGSDYSSSSSDSSSSDSEEKRRRRKKSQKKRRHRKYNSTSESSDSDSASDSDSEDKTSRRKENTTAKSIKMKDCHHTWTSGW